MSTICETCGAAVFSDRCDLCGTPVSNPDASDATPDEGEVVTPLEKPGSEAPVEFAGFVRQGKVVCPTCGAANRPGARFCDQCGEHFDGEAGHETVQPPRRQKPPRPRPPEKIRRPHQEEQAQPRIGLYIAGAVVAVIALYFLSVMSGGSSTQPSATPPVAAAASASSGELDTYLPEDDGLASSLADKRTSIEAATDEAVRQTLQEEVIQSYVGAGRLDLAGREQEIVAASLNTADAWAAAGNMHFDWMENQSGSERIKAAQRAARDYEKALAIDPNNLDIRTDLGVAYLNDPESPMLAIQNTNQVLAADSNHVQANFNKGVMLAQIGRTDEAIRHFRKVVRLSSPGDPAHDRAIEVLKQLGAPAPEGSAPATSG